MATRFWMTIFCHHIHEIREHSKRHIWPSFRLELNRDWIFSFKKITLTGSEFLLEEIIDLSHSEVKCLLSNRKFIWSTCFLTWVLLHFWLVDRILQHKFLSKLNSYRIHFSFCLDSKQLSHSDLYISLPNLTQHDFFRVEQQHELVSGFWTRYCLARSPSFADEAFLNSIEIPLSVWNLLESRILRFLEDAISGALLTEDERDHMKFTSKCSQPTPQSCNASRIFSGLWGTRNGNR